jgi:RimJ/RimL family protein N-acetyltransferase
LIRKKTASAFSPSLFVSSIETPPILTTRLVLRRWKASDREPFARLNADPRVMRFFPSTLLRAESDEIAERIVRAFAERGWGLYAAESRASGEFLGFIGLSVPGFRAHFTPCVEIGWRLAAEHWNRGLATEGARAVVAHAFETLKLPELVSFTTESNFASRRVMEKIGMRHDPADDFDHPRLAEGHPLRRHVLYRLSNRVAEEEGFVL